MRTLALATAAVLCFGASSAALAAQQGSAGHGARAAHSADQKAVSGTGVITKLKGDSITLKHGPMPALNWPPMTMQFKLHDAALAKDLKVGDMVDFELVQDKRGYVIAAIKPKTQ
jgi:Cu/Ag efflux protein CusF